MKKIKLDTFILRGKVTDASYSYRYTLKMHTEAKAFVYITAESLTDNVDEKTYEMIWDLTQPHGFVIIKHLLKEAKTKKEENEIRRYTKELARLISKKAIVRAKNTKNEFYDYWKAVQNAIKDEEKEEDDVVKETKAKETKAKETKAKTKKKGTKLKLSEATYEDICSFNDKRILKIAEHFKFKSKDIEVLRKMIIERLNLVPADVDVVEDEDIKVDETNNSYDDGLNDDLIAENEELIAEVERLKARIQELEAINDKLTKELKNSKAECSKAINETKKAKEKVAAASSKAKEEIKPSINVEELKASIKAELKAELLEELKASLVPATVATTPQAEEPKKEEPKKEEKPKAQKLTGEQLLESGKALEDMKYQELKAIGKHLKLGAKNNSPKAALLNHIKTELAKLDSDGEVAVTDVQEDIKLNADTTTQNADTTTTTTQNAVAEEPIADDVEDDIDDDFMDGDDSYDDDFSDDEEVSSSNKVAIDPSKLSAAQVAVLKRLGRL